MLKILSRGLFVLFFLVVGSSYVFAEMSSPNYRLLSVTDNAGETKSSSGFKLLDSVGQSTPIGASTSSGYQLEAGFISTTVFSQSISEVLTGTTAALVDMQAQLTALWEQANGAEKVSLNRQINKIEGALASMQRALDSFALYEAGDLKKLSIALNQTRQAIKDMEGYQAITPTTFDTVPYQKMLAQASELNVTAEINRIAATINQNDPAIIAVRGTLATGSTEVLTGAYWDSINTFKQAYNAALAI